MGAIESPTRIAEYSKTEAALAELTVRYQGVTFEVTTKDGMKAAKTARATLRDLRVALETKRQEIKEPVLVQGRLIDSEAKRISKALEALEDPIDAQIKGEERKQEEIRLA